MFSVTWGICGKIIYHFFLDEINRKCAKSKMTAKTIVSYTIYKLIVCFIVQYEVYFSSHLIFELNQIASLSSVQLAGMFSLSSLALQFTNNVSYGWEQSFFVAQKSQPYFVSILNLWCFQIIQGGGPNDRPKFKNFDQLQ